MGEVAAVLADEVPQGEVVGLVVAVAAHQEEGAASGAASGVASGVGEVHQEDVGEEVVASVVAAAHNPCIFRRGSCTSLFSISLSLLLFHPPSCREGVVCKTFHDSKMIIVGLQWGI